MIRRLIILLLIVGCAHRHPKASFHIGMTDDEFKQENPTLNKVKSDPMFDILSIHSYIEEQDKQNIVSFLTFGAVYGDYTFVFKNDTLTEVAHGIFVLHNNEYPN